MPPPTGPTRGHAGPDEGFEAITTDRLTIRRFRPEDAATFAAYRSDPEVARYQGWDTPFSEEQARRFIDGLEDAHPDTPGEWFQFAVVERETATHVGDLAASVDAEDPTLARIGFTIAPASQRRGYAAEALIALLGYLIVDRGKRRVVADCDARNAASAALLARVGMRREAHHLQSGWWKGEWTDEYVYAVLATEWPRTQPARRRPAARAARSDDLGELAAELDRVAAETRFAGIVRIDGAEGPVLAEAYGLADRSHGVANTIGTRFGTASVTKGVTALTVVRLVEEGHLALDTTARSLLGEDLPMVADAVTVEHLLAHRSGIGDYVDEEAGWEPTDHVLPVPVHELATSQDYLRVLDGFPMKAVPGEGFSYCNSGYVVLALLAERASATPFHELAQEHVCRRAGLQDTAFLQSDELPGGVARGYLQAEGLRTNVLHLPVRGSGDGGMYSTAADLHALWTAFFAGRIVAPGWVREMVRPRSEVPSESMRYGLGFWLEPTGSGVVLEGCDAGVSCRSVHDPVTGTTSTVLSNTSDGAWPLARLLRDGLPPSG
jgi:CubicO group peptidase (beta-lactamase class C family)/RimJ/RimL family protein N-acetyltransferase